jgi:flagellar biosynthesis/type III secretory pathway M-ring protein FliF/YscJ
MSAMNVFAAGVVLQTEPNIDPDIVRPGWTPLLIIVLLLVVLVFLFLSMQKQMRKIRTPDDIAREQAEAEARTDETPPAAMTPEPAPIDPPADAGTSQPDTRPTTPPTIRPETR